MKKILTFLVLFSVGMLCGFSQNKPAPAVLSLPIEMDTAMLSQLEMILWNGLKSGKYLAYDITYNSSHFGLPTSEDETLSGFPEKLVFGPALERRANNYSLTYDDCYRRIKEIALLKRIPKVTDPPIINDSILRVQSRDDLQPSKDQLAVLQQIDAREEKMRGIILAEGSSSFDFSWVITPNGTFELEYLQPDYGFSECRIAFKYADVFESLSEDKEFYRKLEMLLRRELISYLTDKGGGLNVPSGAGSITFGAQLSTEWMRHVHLKSLSEASQTPLIDLMTLTFQNWEKENVIAYSDTNFDSAQVLFKDVLEAQNSADVNSFTHGLAQLYFVEEISEYESGSQQDWMNTQLSKTGTWIGFKVSTSGKSSNDDAIYWFDYNEIEALWETANPEGLFEAQLNDYLQAEWWHRLADN